MEKHQGVGAERTGWRSGVARLRRFPGPGSSIGADESYIEKVVATAVLLILGAGCFVVLRPFLTAILWATILSFTTWPAYVRLERALNGRGGLAASIMALAVATLLLAPVILLGMSLAENVVRLIDVVRTAMAAGLPPLPKWAANAPFIGRQLSTQWERAGQDAAALSATIQPYVGPFRDWLLARGGDVLQGIVQLTLSLTVAFFFYRDGPALLGSLDAVSVRLAGARAGRLIRTAGSTINGVVRGVLGTALIQAILMAIALWAAGVPGAGLLGFASFFLSLIPMALTVIWLPATIWLASQDAGLWAAVIAIWGLFVGQIDNILRPYLIRRGSELPTLLILLGILGGALAFGFIGIFLGPTLLAIGHSLVREWSTPDRELSNRTAEPQQSGV